MILIYVSGTVNCSLIPLTGFRIQTSSTFPGTMGWYSSCRKLILVLRHEYLMLKLLIRKLERQ